MAYDTYDDLASFDGDLRPEYPVTAGIDTLMDGDYLFEITEASLEQTEKSRERILRLMLLVNGRRVEKAYFFKKQGSVNSLMADLVALGFDADKWGAAHKRSLAVELPKAVAKLKGIKFRATKRFDKRGESGEGYHNLYIAGRVAGANGNGTTPAPSSGQTPRQQTLATAATSEKIPF